MSEHNKALVKSLYDELNKGNLDVIETAIADSFVEHEALPGFPATREGVKALFQMLLGAFPDLHMSTTHSISEGDLVAVFVTATGTHRGEFMGIPATGKAVSINMTDWMRVQNGKVTEHWGVMDMAGMMQQLGVGAP